MGWLRGLQVYEFNVPTFGKGVVFDVDHKVGRPCFSTGALHADSRPIMPCCC